MHLARLALLLALVACGTSETPYVILRIEDPSGLGGSGTMLVVTDSSGNSTQLTPVASGFPMTLTLTSTRKGPQNVTVDLYAAVDKVGHGAVSIDFAVVATQTVALVLDAVCSDASGCSQPPPRPPACTGNSQCDDGVFCNGQETCSAGQCAGGAAPCVVSVDGCVTRSCSESTDQCVTSLDDAVCSGGAQPRHCDVNLGCVVTPHSCTYGTDCDDGLTCNGKETCPSGTCVAGTPPTAGDPGTECAAVVCSETYGVGVANAPDGTLCNNGQDACYHGQCLASPPPACAIPVHLEIFAAGQLLGGVGHEITVTNGANGGVHFPASDGGGFFPTWAVLSSDADPNRPRDIGPLGSSNRFTFYVTSPALIASMRVRSSSGALCRIATSPALHNAVFVRSRQFATIDFEGESVATGVEQMVRFVIDCEGSTAAVFRFTDVCLVARP